MIKNYKFYKSFGFTLLEALVALTILSIMAVFMFSIIDSAALMWRTGNKKMEAARAANIGLNIVANNFSKIVSGSYSIQYPNGIVDDVVVPFQSILSPTNTIGLGGGATNAVGSQMIRAVASDDDGSLKEIGLMCVFIGNADGYDSMQGKRYYLVFKDIMSSVVNIAGEPSWPHDAGTASNFFAIIDNCIRLNVDYAITQFTNAPVFTRTDPITGANTTIRDWTNAPLPSGAWLEFTNHWGPTTDTSYTNFEFPDKKTRSLDPEAPSNLTYKRLSGVMIAATIIDSETAEKIAQIKDGNPLTEGEINAIDSQSPSTPVENLIKQNAVTVRRFISINPPQY